MKLSLSKSPILVTLVIVALAAGTALVAGYVDQPGQSQKACTESKCSDCPREGTDTCCEATGVCPKAQACAGYATAEAFAAQADSAVGVGCAATKACPRQEVESACAATCEPAEAASCPAGGCCPAK